MVTEEEYEVGTGCAKIYTYMFKLVINLDLWSPWDSGRTLAGRGITNYIGKIGGCENSHVEIAIL